MDLADLEQALRTAAGEWRIADQEVTTAGRDVTPEQVARWHAAMDRMDAARARLLAWQPWRTRP